MEVVPSMLPRNTRVVDEITDNLIDFRKHGLEMAMTAGGNREVC